MTTSPRHHTLLLSLVLASSFLLNPAHSDPNSSAHDDLVNFGLPKGLVPNNVDNYILSEDGSFTIQLSQSPCYVNYVGNTVRVSFNQTITGKVSKGVISNINGINAFKIFAWALITKVTASLNDGRLIFETYFGFSESHSISWFNDVPTCKTSLPSSLREEW